MLLEIPPSGFDWQAVGGIPPVIDPYVEEVAQRFPFGTKLFHGDRQFRYASAGVAIETGALCQAVVPLAGHIAEVGTVANVAGDTSFTFTPAVVTTDDLAANELQDGYALVYDGTGEGHIYKIKSHPAIVGAVAGVITLLDPIVLATAAATPWTVLHNKYRQVIIHPSPPTAAPVGWTQTAIQAGYFFWLLVAGPTPALIDSGGVAVVMGQPCVPSTEDDGAVQQFSGDTAAEPDQGLVGWILEIGADAAGAAATYGVVDAFLGH